MGYQTAPHGSLGLPGGLYQFMALTEGTPLPKCDKTVGFLKYSHIYINIL